MSDFAAVYWTACLWGALLCYLLAVRKHAQIVDGAREMFAQHDRERKAFWEAMEAELAKARQARSGVAH